jgi:hypothetical protein
MAGLLTSPVRRPADQLVNGDLVAATVRLWAQSDFAWGSRDCLVSVVRYVAEATGQPMPKWPRYASGPAALRILRRHGGLEGYAAMVLERLGCTRTDFPVRGDVGILDIPGTGLTACLCLGGAWAARGQHGVAMISLEADACWAVKSTPARRMEAQPCRS